MNTQHTKTTHQSVEPMTMAKSLLRMGLSIFFFTLVVVAVRMAEGPTMPFWHRIFLYLQSKIEHGVTLGILQSNDATLLGGIFSFSLMTVLSLSLSIFFSVWYFAAPSVSRFWLLLSTLFYAGAVIVIGFADFFIFHESMNFFLRYVPSLLLSTFLLFAAMELQRERKKLARLFLVRVGIFIVLLVGAGSIALHVYVPAFDIVQWLFGLVLCCITMSLLLFEGSWSEDKVWRSIVWMNILQGSSFAYTLFSTQIDLYSQISSILCMTSFIVPLVALGSKMATLFYFNEHRRWTIRSEKPVLSNKSEIPKDALEQMIRKEKAPTALLNSIGQVVFASEGYALMVDRTLRQIIGQAPDDWTQPLPGQLYLKEVLSQISVRKKSQIVQMTHRRADGSLLEVSILIDPVIDTYGDVGWYIIAEQDQSDTGDRTLLLKQILENMHLGMCLVEVPTTRIVHANAYALVLLRRIGFPDLAQFSDLYPCLQTQKKELYQKELIPLEQTLKTMQESQCDDIVICSKEKDVPDVIWRVQTIPVFDRSGTMKQILLSFDDITLQKAVVHKMSDYVSIVAHQMRTPLTVFRWSLDELIGNTTLPKDDQQKVFASLSEATDGLRSVVQSLLNVCSLENGNSTLKLERTKVDDLITAACTDFEAPMKTKNIKFQKSILQTLPESELDISLARQMIQYFIDNAVKYSNNNGTIDSIISVENNRVHWTLHDTGIGISKENLEKIFEKFHRSDSAQHMYAYGLGIGLYAAKMIADLLKCQIKCESEEGLGTTFHVYFPTALPAGKN